MSAIAKLVGEVAQMKPEVSRKVAAMVGAVVGDAASLSLEWIYDQAKVSEIVGSEDPSFWRDSHCPFFKLPNGHYSCYADEAVQSLHVMAENGGKFDEKKLCEHYCHHFGDPESSYQVALSKRKNKQYPIEGPWIQGTLISMMDRYKAGMVPPGPEDAHDHDGLCTALPLILQQGSNLDFEELKKAFKIVTIEDTAIDHHFAEAYLISQFLEKSEDPVELTRAKFSDNKMISDEISAVQEGVAVGESTKDLTKKFGMACPLPGSFQSSLVSIMKAESFSGGIKETILSGGDCCSRSNLVGACLGAKYGIEGIPLEWIEKVDGVESIIGDAIKCFKN